MFLVEMIKKTSVELEMTERKKILWEEEEKRKKIIVRVRRMQKEKKG